MENRKIIHVDMDCFYAAVEEKYNPKLKGLPMAVGGPANSRAVICTANYAARKFGVKAAVPSSRALRLCPQLIIVPPHFELYKIESRAVQKIFTRFTDLVQPLSLDEAYLDVTANNDFRGSATLIAQEIRQQIFTECGLTASAGISSNKFLAKVASDWNKPNGQFVIRPEQIADFMLDLPIEKIYGVGKVTAEKMHQLNLKTCGDLQKLSLSQLQKFFGSSRAQDLYQLCRGRDERFRRSEQSERIRGLMVKLKFRDFKTSTHEQCFRGIPQIENFEKLLRAAWERRADSVRLLGLGARLQSSSSEKSQNSGSSEQLRFAV